MTGIENKKFTLLKSHATLNENTNQWQERCSSHPPLTARTSRHPQSL